MLSFGVVSYNSQPADSIAIIDGLEVKLNDYHRAIERAEQDVRKQYGSQADAYIKAVNLPQQIMNQLINNAVLIKGAERYGLRITDLEVARSIVTNPNFHTDQRFNEKKYQNLLENSGLSNISYEASLRDSLQTEKIVQFIGTGPSVSQVAVDQEYQRQNTAMKIEAIELRMDRFKNDKKIGISELEKYYEEHKGEFVQQSTFVLDYFRLSSSDFMGKINIREKEINKYYKKNQVSQFTTKESFHARHILISMNPNSDEKALNKAKETADKIYIDLTKNKKSFSRLAKKYSSDSLSAKKGGDLGWTDVGTFVREFEATLQQLSIKEISKPVLTNYGYHIIELLEHKQASVQSLEEVKEKIIENIKIGKAKRRLRNKIARIFKNIEGSTLSSIAQDLKKEVVRSEAIDDNSIIEGIGYTGSLYNEISLKQVKEFGTFQISDSEGTLLYEIVSITDETTKPFESVKMLVESKISRNKAQEFYLGKIAEIRQNISTKKQLQKLAKKLKLPLEKIDFRLSDANVPQLNITQPFQEEVFNMKTDQVETISVNGRYFVVLLEEKKIDSNADSIKEKQKIRQLMTQEKTGVILSGLVSELRKTIPIEYNNAVLQALQIQMN